MHVRPVKPISLRTPGVMLRHLLSVVAVTVLLVLSIQAPVGAESPEIEALKKDVDALRVELDEIKTLLRERVGIPMRGVVLGTEDSPFKGAPDARVTVVEFSDYQCPFCGRYVRETFPQIDEAYIKTGKVKYVFRDFPLERIHPEAAKAAEAARCASESGKYWEMHDRLFAHQKTLGTKDLPQHAQALGVNGPAFEQCLDSGKYAAKVRQALNEGRLAGVRATPTFFIGLTRPGDGKITAAAVLQGAQSFAAFQEAIEKLLSSPK
jgi:protein-disulfide isomerase